LNIYHTTADTLPIIGQVKFVLFLFEIPDYRIESMLQSSYNSLYAKISYRYTKLFFPYSLRKTKVIITSSNSTKKDLIQKYGIDENKIQVLYLACDEQFCPAKDENSLLVTRKKYNAEAGYVLHISSSDPRDNTPVVIRAYQRTRYESKIPQKLIICGNIGLEEMKFEKLIRELSLKNSIIFTGRLSEKELAAVYQAADLFIEPSLYEGFGLQVIEAMACGIPVITSNVTSLPEIVGDAGILVSPTDIESLASAMVKILTDSGLNQTLRQKSLERAKFFSWDRAAQETLDIYNKLLSQ
jgi:glycosyltransferase involved in cell wall biosynthesis